MTFKKFGGLFIALLAICCGSNAEPNANISNRDFIRSNIRIDADSIVAKLRSGGRIRLDTCQVYGGVIYHDTISSTVEIRATEFHDAVDFSSATFRLPLLIDTCTFSGIVLIGGTVFDSSVIVNNCRFRNKVEGASLWCKGYLTAWRNLFDDIVTLDKSHFAVGPWAKLQRCQGEVSLQFGNFDSSAFLAISSFERGVDLSFCRFRQPAFLRDNDWKSTIDFTGAYLRGTKLIREDLINADFYGADMKGVIFEPKTVPKAIKIYQADNIDELRYSDNPSGLVMLRSEFDRNGFQDEARKITYALRKSQNVLRWERATRESTLVISKWADHPDSAMRPTSYAERFGDGFWFFANYILFDYTCKYGLSYGLPLVRLIYLFVICSLAYAFLIMKRRGGDIVIVDERENVTPVKWHVSRAQNNRGILRLFPMIIRSHFRMFSFALLFSLSSAFSIGFRDFNIGRWISLLPKTGIRLRPLGRARTVSGIQAIISVYLFALFLLSFFGHPFD